MAKIVSKDVFDHLLDHMLDIHRNKLGIISAYTLDYDSYTGKLNFLNSYIRGIEAFLENALTESETTELPFVILGSTVHVRQAGVGECIRMRIVLPKEQDSPSDKDIALHSCFSDWGNAILLKHAGEHVRIGHPAVEYVIERVTMDVRIKAPVEKINIKN